MNKLFLDILFPRSCAGCKKADEAFCAACQAVSYKNGAQCLICGFRNSNGKICRACAFRRKISDIPIKNVIWAGRYEGALREAVRGLKYGRRRELAEPLAEMMFKKFLEIYGITEINQQKTRVLQNAASFAVIPIPLYLKKQRERGFNQAKLIAEKFSKLSGIEMRADILEKIKETPTQVELQNKDARIQNLENTFFANDNLKKYCLGKTIILIDDVSTTGATLFHSSRALAMAGAQNIIGLVVAHG